MKRSLWVAGICCLLVCTSIVWPATLLAQGGRGQSFDILITGGRIIDGTGNPWFLGDVGITAGRISAVGPLKNARAARTIDAVGKTVVPGFIDIHSHGGDAMGRGLTSDDPRYRAAPNMVAQGATTLVINQDGRSPWPIKPQIEAMKQAGIGSNAIVLVGHGTLRSQIMQRDFERMATDVEIVRMAELMRQAMIEGAYGMSAGHEYSPMIWSTTDEIVVLVKEIAPWNGLYIVHERASGADPMWWLPSQHPRGAPTMLDAVMETIEVAERTGVNSVQTHLKARGAGFWGSGQAIVQLIESARSRGVTIWGDAYSYNTTGSDGNTVLIPRWVRQLAREEAGDNNRPDYGATLARLLKEGETASKIRKDVRHEMMRRGSAENIMIVEHRNPELVGVRLLDLARSRGVDPVEMALRLQLEGDVMRPGGARLRGFSLSEIDMELFHAQSWVISASDAGIARPGDGLVHPRFYGNFPRKIRHYAQTRGLLTVEHAIRSMTSLPAQVLGIRDRGLVREGNWADLVILDLETIQDNATPLEPHQYPDGIAYVMVNGEFVVADGELTQALPGVVITPSQ